VRGDVERGLDGDLQGGLDESLLLHVPVDHVEAGERPELGDVRLDAGELLGDEVGVGHAGRAGATRR
jgi:hypothetical protein